MSVTRPIPPSARVAPFTNPVEVPSAPSGPSDTLQTLLAAVAAVEPRFRHVAVAHLHLDQDQPLAASSRLASRMAREQLSVHGGALYEAVRTGLPVIVAAADRADRFPEVLAAATVLGVRTHLAVPLLQGGQAVGALSVCTTVDTEVDLSMLELAEALAAQAALVVEQHRLVADLTVAVASRERIGQACGILMSRFVLTADEAFAALSRASQNRNVKVRDLAAEVVRTGTLPELD